MDSDVCAPEGFSVDVVEDVVEKFRVFFDRSGEVARISVHVDYRSVITANGHTIVERDKWMDVFYPDGTARKVGDTVHIQGPAGMVQHDAGQIVFNPDGSVAALHGPRPAHASPERENADQVMRGRVSTEGRHPLPDDHRAAGLS